MKHSSVLALAPSRNEVLGLLIAGVGLLSLVLAPFVNKVQASTSNIVELAVATPELSTLVDLVVLAELDGTLSDTESEFTVFAPVNSAFEALPTEVVEALLDPANKEVLAGILTYHVVSGTVLSTDLTDGQEVTTVQGGTLTVGIDGATVTLTDQVGRVSTVTTADVAASNGVVHIVDTVVLDQEYDFTEEEVAVPTGGEESQSTSAKSFPTVVEYLQSNESFSTLVSALQAAELVSAVGDASSTISVLAPTNDAFGKLPAEVLEDLLKPENKEALQDILKYHVVLLPTLGALTDGQVLETLNGATLTVVVNETGQFIRDAVGNLSRLTLPVTAADGSSLGITAGSVYELDTVLIPTAAASEETLEDTGINTIIVSLIALIAIVAACMVFQKSEVRA